MTPSNEPVSNLDARLDDLAVAIAQTHDIDGLIEGVSGHELLLATVSPDHPASVSAISVAGVWRALGAVAIEVRQLLDMKEGD